MTKISKAILTSAALVALLSVSQTANALTVIPAVGGGALGGTLLNFDLLALTTGTPAGSQLTGPGNSVTVSYSPNGRVVQGEIANQFAAPYLSGANGTGFGSQPIGDDATTYLTSGSQGNTAGASVSLTFTTGQLYFGILWGSVDTYNLLTFYNAANVAIGTVDGADLLGLGGLGAASGDQGQNGTAYVNIGGFSEAFFKVVATSEEFAFEFDNVAYAGLDITTQSTVPDGGTTSILLGLALTGVGLIRRRMR